MASVGYKVSIAAANKEMTKVLEEPCENDKSGKSLILHKSSNLLQTTKLLIL